MEDFQATWSWVRDELLPYTPPLAYALLFAYFGQVSKRYVLTEAHIRSAAKLRDRLWNHGGAQRVLGALLKVAIGTPLSLHPVMAAALLAAAPLPMPPGLADDYWHRLFILETAALCSSGLYSNAHALLRRKGLDFQLPGESSPPPPLSEGAAAEDALGP